MKYIFVLLSMMMFGCVSSYHEDYIGGEYVWIDHHWVWRTRHVDGRWGGWEYRYHEPAPPHGR